MSLDDWNESALTIPTKMRLWHALINKVGIAKGAVAEELIEKLEQRNANGGQVKNACRTATSLARSHGQYLGYEHLEETLNAIQDFVTEFAAMKG